MSRHSAHYVHPSRGFLQFSACFHPAAAVVFACAFALLPSLVVGQDEPSEESMAAYADAANFQNNGAMDLAIDGWNKFLRKYPKHSMAAKAAHYLGVCHMQKSDPDYVAASKAFDRALKDKSYDLREESLANHGWCLYASAGEGEQRDATRLKRSLETYKALQKEFPKSQFLDRAMFYSGEAAYGLNQANEAIDYYDKLLSMPEAKDSPLRCDALYARGVAYEDLDQFDDAFGSYKQLLGSCDKSELVTDVHQRVGDIMILRKDFDKAIASFAAAFASTDSDEDRSYALFRQAFALVQANRPAEAAEKYEQLLAEFPDSKFAASAVLASAQSSYRSGDIDEAAKRFRRVLEQNNLQAATEAAHWIARIEIGKGRADEAAAIVKKQLERGTEGQFAIDLRLDLAEALSMNPNTVEESMVLFEKVYRDAPGDPLAPRALYNAAFSALQISQPDRALKLALEFVSKFPEDTLTPDIRFVAAESQLMTGKAKEAADTYKALLVSTSKDNMQRPLWLLRAAAACNSAQEYESAIEILSSELGQLKQPNQKAEAQLLIGEAQLRAGQPLKAAKSFEASHKTAPNWARAEEAELMQGQAQLAAKQTDKAVKTWRTLIKSSPKSRMADQARYKLAQMETGSGNFRQAAAIYDDILKSNLDPPLRPYAQYGKGWALLQSQNHKEALVELDRMLSENKQHPLRNDATLARGITLRNLGKYDQATTDLQNYLAIPPQGTNLGHTLYELALIDQSEKAPGKAAQKLARLVKEVPDYPSMDKVLYELGWSLQESGDNEGAVEHFETLISKYPDTPLIGEAAYFVGQRNYAAAQWESAAKYFEIAANKAADADLSEKSLYRLGWSQFKAADYDAAEQAFSQQAKNHPKGKLSFDAVMMVGECRFKEADFKKSLAGYESARELIRKNNDHSKTVRDPAERQVRELVFLHGGQSAAQLKSWDVAIQWYDELRERFPASKYLPQLFYETGFAYQQKGDTAEALKFFGEVADNYRNELAARARFMMGEIHFANRSFDKAIPEFQRVMYGFGAEKAPDRIKNWQAKSGFEAARCSELLMQVAKTQASKNKAGKFTSDFYKYVIEKHPKHELASKSRERLGALKK